MSTVQVVVTRVLEAKYEIEIDPSLPTRDIEDLVLYHDEYRPTDSEFDIIDEYVEVTSE